MARSRLLIAVGFSLAAGAVLGTAATSVLPSWPAAPGAAQIQDALKDLQAGRFDKAEQRALQAATDPCAAAPRAWAIVAAARHRRGNYAEAAGAYRFLLASAESADLRRFALEQIAACEQAQKPARQPQAPSQRLSGEQLARLAVVGDQTFAESSDHFVVRARNAELARLVTAEAEGALERICGSILGGQSFPHSVRINVWTDQREFRANATEAPEWAGGGFRVDVKDGQLFRRIDLTQRDGDGKFAVVMLDRVLPHEMCHLVVKEFFGDASCPLFLHEGLAMMAESGADNARIELAGRSVAGRARLYLEGLLVADRSDLDRPQVFYAQSFSFVEFLHSRLDRGEFRRFLQHVRGGSPVAEAVQRCLYVPSTDRFLPRLADAWEDYAVTQGQFLQALRGPKLLAVKSDKPD